MISVAASCFQYYAGWADKIVGDTMPADDGVYKIIRYEPLGVCAGIGAWNATMLLVAAKGAPALAAGNTFIFKSSEKSPFGALALGPLIKECFPPGVINLLSGDGETGALLASHMRIRKISFTGSIPTGRKIQDAATKSNLKRVTLELGGKSAAVVFDDADIENALNHNSQGFLLLSGQVCAVCSLLLLYLNIKLELCLTSFRPSVQPWAIQCSRQQCLVQSLTRSSSNVSWDISILVSKKLRY